MRGLRDNRNLERYCKCVESVVHQVLGITDIHFGTKLSVKTQNNSHSDGSLYELPSLFCGEELSSLLSEYFRHTLYTIFLLRFVISVSAAGTD